LTTKASRVRRALRDHQRAEVRRIRASDRRARVGPGLGLLRHLKMKIIEVTALCGYYTLVAMTPNASASELRPTRESPEQHPKAK
jgi:hypothetical protein